MQITLTESYVLTRYSPTCCHGEMALVWTGGVSQDARHSPAEWRCVECKRRRPISAVEIATARRSKAVREEEQFIASQR